MYIYNVWGHDSIQFYDTMQFNDSIQYEREAGGDHPLG